MDVDGATKTAESSVPGTEATENNSSQREHETGLDHRENLVVRIISEFNLLGSLIKVERRSKGCNAVIK